MTHRDCRMRVTVNVRHIDVIKLLCLWSVVWSWKAIMGDVPTANVDIWHVRKIVLRNECIWKQEICIHPRSNSYNLGALSLSTVHVPVITRTIKFVFRLRAAHAQIFTGIQFSHVFATTIKAVTVTGNWIADFTDENRKQQSRHCSHSVMVKL